MKPLPLSKKGYANMNGYTNMNQTVKHSDFSETNARLKRDYYDKIDYITLTFWQHSPPICARSI